MSEIKPKQSQIRISFNEKYDNFNDHDLLKEILFFEERQLKKMELIRSNTSVLVWWLIVIPIVSWIIYLVISGAFS